MHPPFGILNIDKPRGISSRNIVDRVVRLVRPAKAGHAGTLDPMATGVLVVCVGPATRLVEWVQQHRKVYRARFLLGKRSNTDDIEGDVVDTPDSPTVTRAQIEGLLPRFIGQVEQTPPQFSAVHVDGERAYKLARQGKTVDIKPRTVEIHRLTLTDFTPNEFELEIECGSGTYVRSIGRDLGELLGSGAVMCSLVRTRVGPYCLDEAIPVDQLTADSMASHLLQATTAVAHLPGYRCQETDLDGIRNGCSIIVEGVPAFSSGDVVAVTMPDGQLACLADYCADTKTLAPKRVFLT